MASLTSTPTTGGSGEGAESAGPPSPFSNIPSSSNKPASHPSPPASSNVEEAMPFNRSSIIRQLNSGLTSLRELAGSLVPSQAPADGSSQNLQAPTALDLAIYSQLASTSALLQLAYDSLPVADLSSVEQHQIGETEQIESELNLEAEETEMDDAEIVLQECRICSEDKPVSDFTKITGTCEEISSACNDCVQRWLEEELEGNTWRNVKCLDSAVCDELLQHIDWQRIASEKSFTRYDYLVTKEALDAISDFRYCLNPECNSGQEHVGDPYDPVFKCHACGHEACATHNVPWHVDECCEEYELRTNPAINEEASLAEITRTTRKCPGLFENGSVCGVSIMKNGGCAHMTCTRCDHEFCYFCLADWTDDYVDHAEDCEREN